MWRAIPARTSAVSRTRAGGSIALDGAPEPLDEDTVPETALAIYAYPHAVLDEQVREVRGCEFCSGFRLDPSAGILVTGRL